MKKVNLLLILMMFNFLLNAEKVKKAPLECSKENERNLLIKFYDEKEGAKWNNNKNWKSEKPVGEWSGVKTDKESGCIIKLKITKNKIKGGFPSYFSDINNLEELDLSDNRFTGALPPEIGKFTNLKNLILYMNQFSGELPKELFNLTKLETLAIFINVFVGSIPPEIGNLVNLETLTIFTNSFSGELPKEIGNLKSLRTFQLGNNGFTGEIPKEFGGLTMLMDLSISDNPYLKGSLRTSPNDLCKVPVLEYNGSGLNCN